MKRRSLSNPPNGADSNRRTTQLLKIRGSSVDGGSHIPRPRIRSLSSDRLSGRKSALLKQTGKVSIGHHALATPKRQSYSRSTLLSMSTSKNARSPSAERASILAGAKGPRKDSRPIAEKAFQFQMLKKVDNYFHRIQQSSMLNANGSLKPLSIKMFVDVSGLLVGLLGVKHTLNNINYVEEMPKIAKKLHYPGQMSKAWLKTANAMHALPNALAWLSWLVELCEIKDLALEQFSLENLPFTSVNDSAEKNRNLFLSMIDWYVAWNENAELEETLVAQFLQKEETRHDVSDETFEQVSRNYENKIEELEQEDKLRLKIDSETKQLQDILMNLKQDSKSIDEYFIEQNEHIDKLNDENKIIESDCAVLDEDVEKNILLQEQLKNTISMQPITPTERDEIIAKCNDIKKFLKELSNHLEDIQKDIYSRDMKLSSANHNLTKTILKYNRDIHYNLAGIPGVDIADIQIPDNIAYTEAKNIIEHVSTALTNLKDKKEKELDNVQKLVKENNHQLGNLQEKLRNITENNEDLARKLVEKEVKINEIKEQAKQEEAEIRDNIKKLEEKIELMQESRVNLASLKKELDERIDKRDSLRRRKEYLEKRACTFFDNFYSILAERRRECEALAQKE